MNRKPSASFLMSSEEHEKSPGSPFSEPESPQRCIEEKISKFLDKEGVFSEEPSFYLKNKAKKTCKLSIFTFSTPLYLRRKGKICQK